MNWIFDFLKHQIVAWEWISSTSRKDMFSIVLELPKFSSIIGTISLSCSVVMGELSWQVRRMSFNAVIAVCFVSNK